MKTLIIIRHKIFQVSSINCISEELPEKIMTGITRPILFSILICTLLFPFVIVHAQVVSPLQSGHYSPGVKNIRDMATPPPGLFVLWYNVYAFSNKYIDKDGNEFKSIRLDQLYPTLPNIDVNLELNAIVSIPCFFWASSFKMLGGARYIAGVSPNYTSADVSIITERGGIILDTTYTHEINGKVNGFGDLFVMPAGLSWGFEKTDFTFMYGFTAPTGKYETGSEDNIGLGFWTHQLQGFGYYYPVSDKSTAIMLGLTYELNSKINDADLKPGSRLSMEYGFSQCISERIELGILGAQNWQVSDDSGDAVYWDAGLHDRKSTLTFNAGYWIWKEHLNLSAKYGFDYGLRQHFKNNYVMLNILFIPNILTGKN